MRDCGILVLVQLFCPSEAVREWQWSHTEETIRKSEIERKIEEMLELENQEEKSEEENDDEEVAEEEEERTAGKPRQTLRSCYPP